MELEFIGAAREVTGSMHLLHAAGSHILLDCGLFQGRRRESVQRNRERPMSPGLIDAVVLSHAHLDHSGALPLLVKRGYRGPIYATPATRDLCAVMLADAAMIREILGFQAQHTLGRRLVEGRKRVSIFGVERDRRAEVVVLNGFSAHADRDDLVGFAEATRKRGPLRKVLLVHGEPKAQAGLQEALAARGFPDVSAPASGERIRL
ncbi:MAG TPA: MBL fold metallo-hydrolase RNA specificity domain-containing protein [Polyangiales bacterium]